MELSVSILNSDDRKEIIKKLNNSNISYIHIDVMDAIFVSQKTFPYDEIEALSKLSTKKFDVHLMVEDPMIYIEKLKQLSNIAYITIHLEINQDVKYILNKIREYGFKSGLSIKPNTPIESLKPYLDYLDLILIMSVEPGYGGQPFIESSSNKIKDVQKILKNHNSNIKLEADGGINNNTIKKIKQADIAVVGSYITNSNNPLEKIDSLLV